MLEYDQHLGPVNTITFIDDNRRFVSSSDDKSLRIWEWGIPVVIKYISEPHMHSMPAISTHPNGMRALSFGFALLWLLFFVSVVRCVWLIGLCVWVLQANGSPARASTINPDLLATRALQNQPKKRFAGHNVAGFACQPNFSPDGQYVISGDSGGRLFFWEWKTCRILRH